VGLLSWLGLKRGDAYPNLDALMRDLRDALPHDESVLLRYIGTVIVLLGKVAWADGRVTPKEDESLRALLSHIEGLAPSGVDAVCDVLQGKIPDFSEGEMDLVYSELRAICDGNERKQIMRMLVRIAAVDGRLSEAERGELARIADELGVPLADVESDPAFTADGTDVEPAAPGSPDKDPDGSA
jgi:uncharacterized tellurite resistance protein B-like protein